MYFKSAAVAVTAVAALSLTACGTSKAATATPSMTPTMSTSPAGMTMSGTFAGLNGKHVSGTAKVDGMQVALANFATDKGPDLHVYLTNGTDEAAVSAGKEIGKVTYAANESFSIPAGTSMYKYVVVHCDKAKAVFGAAPLS